MTSVPAGQRSWKCPECGSDVLLSIAQLDPMACDTCLAKLKSRSAAAATTSVTKPMAGPMGVWSGLPESLKLGAVVVALVAGLVVGYILGSKSTVAPAAAHRPAAHTKESTPANEPDLREESSTEPDTEERPDPPGPGYKWVKGRKHKDGTYGKGHWAKDPRAADGKGS